MNKKQLRTAKRLNVMNKLEAPTTTGSTYIDLSSVGFESLPWEPFTKSDLEKLRQYANSLPTTK